MKKHKVSKRLGIKAIKNGSIQDYKKRIDHLRKILGSRNPPRGLMEQRAHEYIRMAEYKIRKLQGKPKQRRSKIDTNQMALPGFLRQMDVVKFEELIANKVREEIASLVKPARKTSKKSA